MQVRPGHFGEDACLIDGEDSQVLSSRVGGALKKCKSKDVSTLEDGETNCFEVEPAQVFQ